MSLKDEESVPEPDHHSRGRTHHTFTSGKGSPWDTVVQGVVDSVNAMSKCATAVSNHAAYSSPPALIPASLPSLSQYPPIALPARTFDHNPVHREGVKTAWSTVKNSQSSTGVSPRQGLSASSYPPQSAPPSLPIPSPLALRSDESYSYMRILDTSKPAPAASGAATALPSRVTHAQVMSIYPLLLPPGGRPSIPAHRLSSLYFEAILDSWDIPEFTAEYIYTHGRCSSILLSFKKAYHADRLKEMWDSMDRENTGVPELAHISLYRGDISTKRADKSVRDAAWKELASYQVMF